jgi:alpha-N-acetylglucosaminidase
MEATLSSPSPIQAVTALVQRVLPNHHSRFELELLHSGGASAMQLDVRGDAIILRGTGGVELASALNWYLNKYLNVTYDWNTYAENQVPSQLPLPLPEKSAVIRRRLPISYYMNVCTMGYSLAYVPFSYWEKHIDWMAMSGVNMPLGFVGQEWAWVETFKAFNISFEEQQTFYSGPAFLPWYRMGNFRGFNGPLSTHWLEARRALGVQILDRMRSLGMTPALGAFAGHVPKAVLTRVLRTRTAPWARAPLH